MNARRVVVTGVGIVSPMGVDVASTWSGLLAGKSGIGPITRFDASQFPTKIAGECRGFDPEKYIEKKRVREGDRFIHLAIGASDQAVRSVGLEALNDEQKERVGTFMGTGFCGLELVEKVKETLMEKGPRRMTPYFIPASIANLAPGQVSMRFGFKGPNYTTTSACSSGAHAIGEAFRWIQRGDLDYAVAGGAEATITPLGVGGFNAMRALSENNDAPEKASRPFDKGRDGFVCSEGAGVITLEEREVAMKRGAPILCEIVGYGATSDAYHLTQPAPEGEGAQRAMKHALRDGKIDLERVDYVNAHATSTPIGDRQEQLAMRGVFGEHALGKKNPKGLWVSATKSMTGHLLGAAGGLEAAITALSLQHGIIPPTINLDDPDDDAKDFEMVANEARQRKIDVAISNAFGFGGTNVTLVFTRVNRVGPSRNGTSVTPGTIVVANDHAGLPLKKELVGALLERGWKVEDVGTNDTASVDYPDYAHALAVRIAEGREPLGLLICGSGVGISIAANRHAGVRAVVCSEPYSAAMARRHNDANVLCLGARVVGGGLAREILEAFLEQSFEGGRHAGRVAKIELR